MSEDMKRGKFMKMEGMMMEDEEIMIKRIEEEKEKERKRKILDIILG